MSLKGILHKEYENILKICLVFATIVYNLLIFNVNYFRGSEVKEEEFIVIAVISNRLLRLLHLILYLTKYECYIHHRKWF